MIIASRKIIFWTDIVLNDTYQSTFLYVNRTILHEQEAESWFVDEQVDLNSYTVLDLGYLAFKFYLVLCYKNEI